MEAQSNLRRCRRAGGRRRLSAPRYSGAGSTSVTSHPTSVPPPIARHRAPGAGGSRRSALRRRAARRSQRRPCSSGRRGEGRKLAPQLGERRHPRHTTSPVAPRRTAVRRRAVDGDRNADPDASCASRSVRETTRPPAQVSTAAIGARRRNASGPSVRTRPSTSWGSVGRSKPGGPGRFGEVDSRSRRHQRQDRQRRGEQHVRALRMQAAPVLRAADAAPHGANLTGPAALVISLEREARSVARPRPPFT